MDSTEIQHDSWNRVARRKGQGYITETVERWHEGPGSRGGRSYLILYCPDGRVRIDVGGVWSGFMHEVRLTPEEIRPAAEWMAHLKATGLKPVEPRWCVIDGVEIPQERIDREIPDEPEEFCSRECAREVSDEW